MILINDVMKNEMREERTLLLLYLFYLMHMHPNARHILTWRLHNTSTGRNYI